MKSVYWRPQKMTPSTTLLVGLFSTLALIAVSLSPRLQQRSYRVEQERANQLAKQCRKRLHTERLERGLRVNSLFDPTGSGLLGSAMTKITSKPADLEAKQLSLHPQFPAAIVQLLVEAGVQRGDTVAVGWTGSFPGFNIALAAAIETLELRPITVASVMASQYGANEPEFTWLDMESCLHRAELIRFRSQLATVGGPADRGAGVARDAIESVRAAADRNDVRLFRPKRLRTSIKQRMRLLDESETGDRVAAYINVGGGVASSGGTDCVFAPGLHLVAPLAEDSPDCVMQRMADRGVPVIHLGQVARFARAFRLSDNHESWEDAGTAIRYPSPNRLLAFIVLVSICGVLKAFVLQDSGNRAVYAILSGLRGRAALRIVGQREGPQLMA